MQNTTTNTTTNEEDADEDLVVTVELKDHHHSREQEKREEEEEDTNRRSFHRLYLVLVRLLRCPRNRRRLCGRQWLLAASSLGTTQSPLLFLFLLFLCSTRGRKESSEEETL